MTHGEATKLMEKAGYNQSSLARAIGRSRRHTIRLLKGETPINQTNAIVIATVCERAIAKNHQK